MALDSVLRSGIKTIDKVTAALQVSVKFYPWIGNNSQGGPVYPSKPVIIKAIVEEKERFRQGVNGQDIWQKGVITIPRPLKPTGATDRKEPIDVRDKFVLPSGYFGPILEIMGITDPTTGRAYMYEVIFG